MNDSMGEGNDQGGNGQGGNGNQGGGYGTSRAAQDNNA